MSAGACSAPRTLAALAMLWTGAVAAANLTTTERAADFDQFCRFVGAEYAYFDIRATDWEATCRALQSQAAQAKDRDTFVGVLESALRELYDSHAHLGTNTQRSARLVPTGTALRLAWQDGRAVVTDVRLASAAQRAGIWPGDEVLQINGRPVVEATAEFQPQYLRRADAVAWEYALNVAIAGRHARARTMLLLLGAAGERTVEYAADDMGIAGSTGLLAAHRVGDVGQVRIHNSLGDANLVTAFDAALAQLGDIRGLVLDLRDTPSGGNSSVARGLMGRLVTTPRPYQRHEYPAEFRGSGVQRIWVEYVAPRGAPITVPVIVLVGAWTGSMGEGLAIGLHAAIGARVWGRPMAHLQGALGETRLVHSGIPVRVPNEKLFTVDGSPREAFVPEAVALTAQSSEADPLLEAAVAALAAGSRPDPAGGSSAVKRTTLPD